MRVVDQPVENATGQRVHDVTGLSRSRKEPRNSRRLMRFRLIAGASLQRQASRSSDHSLIRRKSVRTVCGDSPAMVIRDSSL